jgi:hypothetical protein
VGSERAPNYFHEAHTHTHTHSLTHTPSLTCLGVAISVNSGKTFTSYDAGLYTNARYGAFPSDDVWYVAAGKLSSLLSFCVRERSNLGRFFCAICACLWLRHLPSLTNAGDWPESEAWAPRPGMRHGRSRRTQYLTPDGKLNTKVFDQPKANGDNYTAQISKVRRMCE